jgi:hypothetical protein
VLARVAKPVDGDENRVFHRGIAANLPAAINQRLVLKLAQTTGFLTVLQMMTNPSRFVGCRG